ncbi:MAG: T9SS type A sorting domain-containing protein [candidate division Zixibacteria bacterium]|nr:T9SS type A sorting domain-containing protein [candidate division Zixibacteria bacterium]
MDTKKALKDYHIMSASLIKCFCLIAILVLVMGSQTFAEEEVAWFQSAIEISTADQASMQSQPVIEGTSIINSSLILYEDSPDIAVTTDPLTTQSENSVFINPNDPLKLLNSNNSSDWPVTQIYGTSYWMSDDGGQTWSGSIYGPGGPTKGDPAAAIGLNGNYYIGGIAMDYGQVVAYSDDEGENWTQVQVAPGGYILDKNHLWVDNSAISPYANYLYSSWTNLQYSSGIYGEIEISRSIDAGLSWEPTDVISLGVAAGNHNQGVNIQTGSNGEVYVVWTIYDSWPSNETALGLAKSLDGGATWTDATRIITDILGHRITPLGGSKTMRHNSFPSMTVNQQTGQLFVVWTNQGVPGINDGDPDIYMSSSTNSGTSWSTAIRVNQDDIDNGKDQWFPWIACDPVTGLLVCIFYDSRNFEDNDYAETFVAVSQDDGQTWEDFKVSDVAWSGDAIPGFSGGYAGDYLAIASRENKVYPMWSDTRAGNMLVYVSPFEVTIPDDTLYVPDEYSTIQNAIDAAIDGNVVMVGPGLYRESIDFLGKNIVVTSSHGPESTTIQGVWRSRATVYFQSGEPKGAEISGFTITFGNKSGIYCYRSSPTIKNNIISDNYSFTNNNGGGIDLNYTTGSVIRGNLIYGNHAWSTGGGIHLEYCRDDTIAYNVIRKNIGTSMIRSIAGSALIHNNYIECGDSIYFGITNEMFDTLDIRSNIIAFASECGVYAHHAGWAHIRYNCFFECREPFCGNIIDGPGNIHDDPLLTEDFRIRPESRCVDAGYFSQFAPDNYWPDPDDTRNDMGVYPIYQVSRENGYHYNDIGSAIGDVADGDFIVARPGNYYGPIFFIGKRIVVTSFEGPEVTTISGGYIDLAIVNFIDHEPRGAEISGFTISRGVNSGIRCTGSSPTIRNNILQENFSSEMGEGGALDLNNTSGSVIEDNIFTHNTAEGYGAGLYAQNCMNDTIRYNLFESCHGKELIHTDNSSMSIYNNTIDADHTDGHTVLAWQSGLLHCLNNIVVNSDMTGFNAYGGAWILGDYNDVWNYGDAQYGGDVSWGRTNIDADPLFYDYYLIRRESPCIDRGDPDPFFNDPDGSRNDMGWKPWSEGLLGRFTDLSNESALPTEFSLAQSFPNPFNASAIIKYGLPKSSEVTIVVYDLLGRRVATLENGPKSAGYHQVVWQANNHPSGLYFYNIQASDYSNTKKMLLLK